MFPNARLETTPAGSYWLIPERDLEGLEPPKMGRPPKAKETDSKASKKKKGKER